MSPQTHEWVLDALSKVAVLVMLLAVMQGCTGVSSDATVLELFCGSFIGFFALGLMVVYLLPVRCSQAGCSERMQPGWHREKAQHQLQWRLFYRCNTCDEVYISNVTFSVGLGQSW